MSLGENINTMYESHIPEVSIRVADSNYVVRHTSSFFILSDSPLASPSHLAISSA